MKKFKALMSGMLAAACVMSITACSDGGNNTSDNKTSGGANSTEPTTSATTTTFAEDSAVNEAVHNMDVTKLDNPDLEVSQRIEWMAWWDIDETAPAAILFKDVYGVPTTGKYAERDGRIFDYTNVSYGERYDKLATAIASGDSPDFFPFEALDFPYGVLKGRYNAVSDIIDVEGPKWDAARSMMEQFRFGEDYYCAFYEISFNNIMYYKKSNIDAIGADDPRELFESGNWTWDTFLDISRSWQESGDNKYCIDGYNPENDFVISTGVPMVGNDGTKLVNNLHDPSVERAEELLATLQKENLRYPRHELNGWSVNMKAWANDMILFYADGGTWVFEDKSGLKNFVTAFGWSDDEIQVVPFPKDPQADAHYVTAKQDSLMWVKGSDNPNGAAAWLDCCVTVSQDPEVRAAAKQQQKNNYGWSDRNLDAIYAWTALDGSSPLTPIFDFKGGLGEVSDGSACQNPVQSLTNLVYLTGDQSYTQLRAEHEPAIQAAIDEINTYIEKM
ncbi:MAG: extracellular solute-binding protein [Oscillospiraceae bacterium]